MNTTRISELLGGLIANHIELIFEVNDAIQLCFCRLCRGLIPKTSVRNHDSFHN